MSVVIVCSSDQLHEAIAEYHKSVASEQVEKQVLAINLTEFFLDPDNTRTLFTHHSTGIFCFSPAQFGAAFRAWAAQESKLHPQHAARIAGVCEMAIQLFHSTWPVQQGLVVPGCLDGSEEYLALP